MKPYTMTGVYNTTEDLRSNWRGNFLSRGKRFKLLGKIGNSNYHRKRCDRFNKKRYRHKLKCELNHCIEEVNDGNDPKISND